MQALSVVIIAFNEERNIGRCIDSVKEIADDILVVDSFSNDQTEEISKSKGARVVKHEFLGYIEQKNWAITQSKHPFILSLDADECLSKELIQEIKQIKNNKNGDAFIMSRKTNYCGKWIHHCGWYPDRKLRLFDSTKGKWGGINPHDKFEMIKESKQVMIRGDILHYSYYTLNDHINQANKFAEITARTLFAKGRRATVLQILFSPAVKFIRDYFLRLGFLDGYYGFVICRISAYATFVKYTRLRQLYMFSKNEG